MIDNLVRYACVLGMVVLFYGLATFPWLLFCPAALAFEKGTGGWIVFSVLIITWLITVLLNRRERMEKLIGTHSFERPRLGLVAFVVAVTYLAITATAIVTDASIRRPFCY